MTAASAMEFIRQRLDYFYQGHKVAWSKADIRAITALLEAAEHNRLIEAAHSRAVDIQCKWRAIAATSGNGAQLELLNELRGALMNNPSEPNDVDAQALRKIIDAAPNPGTLADWETARLYREWYYTQVDNLSAK